MGLLPDHLHCIWTLPPEDADFGVRWAIIKRFVTQPCNPTLKRDDGMKASTVKRKQSTLWQSRFWEHQIRDERDFEKHVDDIHNNPVKHGLAKQALDWPYSTFHRYVKMGVYGIDWAGITGRFRCRCRRAMSLFLVHGMQPTRLNDNETQL